MRLDDSSDYPHIFQLFVCLVPLSILLFNNQRKFDDNLQPNLSTCESTYEKEASPVSSLSDMRDGDIEAAHYVLCPICSCKYSPQLHIHCYDLKIGIQFSPATSDSLPSVKSQWIPLKCASPISAISSPGVSLLGTPNKNLEEDHLVGRYHSYFCF